MKDIELLNTTFEHNGRSNLPAIYILDDEKLLRKGLKKLLEQSFCQHEVVEFVLPSQFLSFLENSSDHRPFILVSDMSFGGAELDGLALIDQLKKMSSLRYEVVMMTGFGSIETAINATKRGVFKYLTKPFSFDDMKRIIFEAISLFDCKKVNTVLPKVDRDNVSTSDTLITLDVLPAIVKSDQFGRIIGRSIQMNELFSKIEKVSKSNSTILILGESGTGKELVAGEIHARSERSDGKLININCGAIPAEILESELFGHIKGAFTGAISNRVGKFEASDNGSIFLDEIGDMPILLQVKLLRVLQTKLIEPVGSNKAKSIDTRVIAATHKNLETLVKEGKFREDLFYRLNVIPVKIPSLRERKEDIPLMIRFFINKYMSGNKANAISFTCDAYQSLINYDWPGNVRELENLIERLIILKGGSIVELIDLPRQISNSNEARTKKRFNLELPDDGIILKEYLSSIETSLINQALKKTEGNKNKASKLLGVNRTTLIEKLKKISSQNLPRENNSRF